MNERRIRRQGLAPSSDPIGDIGSRGTSGGSSDGLVQSGSGVLDGVGDVSRPDEVRDKERKASLLRSSSRGFPAIETAADDPGGASVVFGGDLPDANPDRAEDWWPPQRKLITAEDRADVSGLSMAFREREIRVIGGFAVLHYLTSYYTRGQIWSAIKRSMTKPPSKRFFAVCATLTDWSSELDKPKPISHLTLTEQADLYPPPPPTAAEIREQDAALVWRGELTVCDAVARELSAAKSKGLAAVAEIESRRIAAYVAERRAAVSACFAGMAEFQAKRGAT